MTANPNRAPAAIPAATLTQRMIGAAVPYVAVLIGMYALQSAWITILLYHTGVLALLILGVRTDAWVQITRGFDKRIGVAGIAVCALAFSV